MSLPHHGREECNKGIKPLKEALRLRQLLRFGTTAEAVTLYLYVYI